MRFEYRLAGHFGCSREQLLEDLDWRELQDWRVLERIEPFGDLRADLHHAILCQLIANIHRDPKSKPFTITDFMPNFEPKKRQSNDDILRIMSALMVVNNRKPS